MNLAILSYLVYEFFSILKFSFPIKATNAIQIRWADGEDQRLGVDEHTNPKLFVGSIPKNATEENLKDVFSQFGGIEELVLMREPDGASKGCAFIKFRTKEEALLAMRIVNGNVYLGGSSKPMEVRFAENKKKPTTSFTTPTETHQSARPQQAAFSNPQTNPALMNPATVFKKFENLLIFLEYAILQIFDCRWNCLLLESIY